MTKGWECPKCGSVYAPWVAKCKRCVAQPEPEPVDYDDGRIDWRGENEV